jgi:hypothetical protein
MSTFSYDQKLTIDETKKQYANIDLLNHQPDRPSLRSAYSDANVDYSRIVTVMPFTRLKRKYGRSLLEDQLITSTRAIRGLGLDHIRP